jgi:hypothetical protein
MRVPMTPKGRGNGMTNTLTSSRGENVDDIQSLGNQVTHLNSAVDWWNSAIIVMMIIAAIAATGLLVTQFIAFKKAAQLADAQANLSSAKEAKLSGELKDKDRQIADLNVKAKEAGVGIATAQTDASNASKKAADAITAQQQVQIELAKQQERAATAEKSLIELQEKIKGRTITESSDTNTANGWRGLNWIDTFY